MKMDKALIVARRILEDGAAQQVTISWDGKATSSVQVEIGDYLPERQFVKVLVIKNEEEVRGIASYRDTGVVLS